MDVTNTNISTDENTSINNHNLNNKTNNNDNNNSNWVWSDEKLSYYDPTTGWYYREDLGYFYFDENNECHYVYPSETFTQSNNVNNDKGDIDNNTYSSRKRKHRDNKGEEEEEEKEEEGGEKEKENDIIKNKNDKKNENSDSELEEGEISEDDEEEINNPNNNNNNNNNNNLNNSSYIQQSNNMYLNQNGMYYQSNGNSNTNEYYTTMGMSQTTYPTEIQLAYGIDGNTGAVTATTGQETYEYENEYLRLVVQSSDLYEKGSIVLVDADGLSIGRDKSYEKRLRLPEMQVSKYHAKIYLEVEYQPVVPTSSTANMSTTTTATTALPVENLSNFQPPYNSLKTKTKTKARTKFHSRHKYEDLDGQSLQDDMDSYDYNMYDENMYDENMYDDDEDNKNKNKDRNKDRNEDKNKDKNKLKTLDDDTKNLSIKNKDEGEKSIKEERTKNQDNGKKEKLEKEDNNENDNEDKEKLSEKNIINEIKEKEEKKLNEDEEEGEMKEQEIKTNPDDKKDNINEDKDKKEDKNNNIEKKIKEIKSEKEENNTNGNNNDEDDDEEEGEIPDDGEYVPLEEEEEKEKEKEEDYLLDNNNNNDSLINSYYLYPGQGQENYNTINYEAQQPQYTCSYHFSIIDMGSTHGTYVNGERLSESKICSKPCPLKNKDIIRIGSTTFIVHYHKPWGACNECTITEHQKEIPLLDKNMILGHHGHNVDGKDGVSSINGYDPHPVSLEEQRKNELKRLKNKYLRKPKKMKYDTQQQYYYGGENEEGGIAPDENENSSNSNSYNYVDRAAQRRELYNTNIPYFK